MMEASKWLTVQALLDEKEMEALLSALESPVIVPLGHVLPATQKTTDLEAFLSSYRAYIHALKEGKPISPEFTYAWTRCTTVLKTLPVGEDRHIHRLVAPAIQLQGHLLGYSPIDQKFRPMVSSGHTLSWGIQWSYPQIYKEPRTGEVYDVFRTHPSLNTPLFRQLQRWIRQHTTPAAFQVGKEVVNTSIRIGKGCLSWIHTHPDLKALEKEGVQWHS